MVYVCVCELLLHSSVQVVTWLLWQHLWYWILFMHTLHPEAAKKVKITSCIDIVRLSGTALQILLGSSKESLWGYLGIKLFVVTLMRSHVVFIL